MDKLSVRAVVQVVLEVESGSVWGANTTWEQIYKQAVDGVRGMLESGNELALKELPRKIKSLTVVGVNVKPGN